MCKTSGESDAKEGRVKVLNSGSGYVTEQREELAGIYCTLMPGDEAELEYREDCAVYRLHNAGGEGTITAYPVFDGVSLLLDDMHMESFGEGMSDSYPLIIEHCRQGRFEVAMKDGRRMYLGAGDVCVHNMDYGEISYSTMPYRHYHGCTIMIRHPHDGMFAAFLKGAGVDIERLIASTRAAGGIYLLRSSERIEHIFDEIYRAAPRDRQGYFRIKLVELLLFLSGENIAPPDSVAVLHPETAELIKRVERWLWANLGERITLSSLCSKFGLSATSLKTNFRVLYGCPLHAYLNTCRMQVAARLLSEGDMKISEVARSVGFTNGSKFSKAFLRYSGVSPRQWRQGGISRDWAFNRPQNTEQ